LTRTTMSWLGDWIGRPVERAPVPADNTSPTPRSKHSRLDGGRQDGEPAVSCVSLQVFPLLSHHFWTGLARHKEYRDE